MITWSNIVAVVIGIAFIYWLYKISDYGNPFIAGIVRMEDKFNRLKSLLNSNEKPNYESVSDTLTDLANYAIMMRIELEGKEGTTQKATQFECKVDADLSSLVGKIMTCPHKSLLEDGAEEINKALRQILESLKNLLKIQI